ncbi:hypothetical protein RD110_20290 [Rhodoferax koreense]|uniref:GGDEF domain-containing protein n=1 Tax=Rhodoferax koreensis TaxID=1842727 RepID=A0A1P8JZU9_9BURK|nr:GGDEF domain-containing protein [Rhodoferax koreense]APW39265.1 hypothetical protein RD110_20290 [Rhodoferax koreense]
MDDGAAQRAAAELASLVRQVTYARGVLAALHAQISTARARLDQGDSAQLREANARLVVAAMQQKDQTDSALQALDALARSAELDGLTQLPNRALMLDRFTQAIAKARRQHTRLALLFIDLDGFKQINDSLGHAAGDDVLRQTARRLTGSVRDVDTVSRHGGDEFLILLADVAQKADAVRVADKLSLAMSASMLVNGHELHLSVSVGICIYPDEGAEPEALIACADAAMYRAKRRRAP